MRILIVGGVAGGASTAARLRRLDEHAQIIMFERGEHVSFANCGIPYYCSDVITERDKLLVTKPETFQSLMNIEARTFSEVVSIDRANKTVTVKDLKTNVEYKESYDKLVLSPGAYPIKPPIEGIDDSRIFTVRNVNDADRIKSYIEDNGCKSAVVVGGGFIGIEMAENLKHKGLDVSVVELSPQVIAPVDGEIAAYVHNHLRGKGVNLYLGDGVKQFLINGELTVRLNSEKEIKTDLVVLAIGVRSETTLAVGAGLEIGASGGIRVNDNMQTSDENIYAVGDAVEVKDPVMDRAVLVPLAGPANRQGRLCADNIAGINHEYKGTYGSSIIKIFDLTVAATGNNEKSLKRSGIDYKKVYIHGLSHAGYYPQAMPMLLKVLFDESNGRILGAQAVGYDGVDKRIDVVATAIKFKATVNDLTELELTYAPPFNAAKDPVNLAGMAGQNVLKGIYKPFYLENLESIDNSVIIDVRTATERDLGYIEGSVHIPLEMIRAELANIPRDKQIILYCTKGFKSYLAQRILQQAGFDNVVSLAGGYLLYKEIKKDKEFVFPTDKGIGIMPSNIKYSDKVALKIDACGMQCPGPIMKVATAVKDIENGETIEVKTTDAGFKTDIVSWCKSTGNTLVDISSDKGIITAVIQKGGSVKAISGENSQDKDAKTIVVFSQDLDRALASFIIANGAAATGKKVTMFFTFWGLNILRRPEKVNTKKGVIDRMFGLMMPKGTEQLTLSKMNMLGMGSLMMRWVMKKKNVQTLQELIEQAKQNGVEFIACQMSLDVMGLKHEELVDGVSIGGVASYIEKAEQSDINLFI